MGTDELYVYLLKYGITLDAEFRKVLGRRKRRPWSKFVSERNEHLVSEEAIDLVDKLLKYDHQERLTAKEAMAHSYFDTVRTPFKYRWTGGAAFLPRPSFCHL